MDRNIFSLPVSRKNQLSMKRRVIFFSLILFLLIFVIGGSAFIFIMGQIMHENTKDELMKTVELEKLRLEASVRSEIAIVLKMADSPLIKRYFSQPDNLLLERITIEEIGAYGGAFASKLVFWVNDIDKIFYTVGHEPYVVNPDIPENYWYNMSLYETEVYNFNINFNPDLGVTNLWINAPVFNNENIPIGIIGTGINISNFIDMIYNNYSGKADLFFFNAAGEITGTNVVDLVKNKINITNVLGKTGIEIFESIEGLGDYDIRYLETKKPDGIAIIGAIPALEWYITAVHHFAPREKLQSAMTLLFIVMMFVIFSIFAVFNIFVSRLLNPLYRIIKEISRLSGDWDLKQFNENFKKNELDTLGEFLNMTIIDQLTGIYNRRFFDGNMKKIIRSLSRTDGKLSLLMIDIDFFKKYNDNYGHDQGDNCLKEVAVILSKTLIREEDFVARYGGEEFVVVLPNTDENGAHLIADRLLKNIYDAKITHETSDVVPFVTVSIGGTTGIVKHSQEEADYVKSADVGLYKSKQNGRNQYTFIPFDNN